MNKWDSIRIRLHLLYERIFFNMVLISYIVFFIGIFCMIVNRKVSFMVFAFIYWLFCYLFGWIDKKFLIVKDRKGNYLFEVVKSVSLEKNLAPDQEYFTDIIYCFAGDFVIFIEDYGNGFSKVKYKKKKGIIPNSCIIGCRKLSKKKKDEYKVRLKNGREGFIPKKE